MPGNSSPIFWRKIDNAHQSQPRKVSGKDEKGIITFKNMKILTVTLFKVANRTPLVA